MGTATAAADGLCHPIVGRAVIFHLFSSGVIILFIFWLFLFSSASVSTFRPFYLLLPLHLSPLSYFFIFDSHELHVQQSLVGRTGHCERRFIMRLSSFLFYLLSVCLVSYIFVFDLRYSCSSFYSCVTYFIFRLSSSIFHLPSLMFHILYSSSILHLPSFIFHLPHFMSHILILGV